jgi:hypothetical protein
VQFNHNTLHKASNSKFSEEGYSLLTEPLYYGLSTHYSTMGLHNFAGVDARRLDNNIIHGSCFPMQAHHARTPVPFS